MFRFVPPGEGLGTLAQQPLPRYARSNEFILEQEDDLGTVLQVLKRLAGVDRWAVG